MSIIKIEIRQKGLRKDTAEKKVRGTLEKMFSGASISVSVYTPPESRSDRFSEAQSNVECASSDFESLKDELETWKDSIPENLQSGEKYSQLEEAISGLEEVIDACSTIAGASVEFPSMMG